MSDTMATTDSAAPASSLPHILEYFWSLVENCTDNGRVHDRGQPQRLRRRDRLHLLACFSREQGKERSSKVHGHHNKISREEDIEQQPDYDISCASSLAKVMEDTDRIEDLEVKLKAVAHVGNSQMRANAIRRVGQWQLEQLKLMIMDAETSLGPDSPVSDSQLAEASVCPEDASQNTAQAAEEAAAVPLELGPFETIQELLKLHNNERDKWKKEAENWKMDRRNWMLTCQKLNEEAALQEQQLRKLTMESRRWKAEFEKLVTAESEGKSVAEVCRDLLEELLLEQQNMDLRRTTEDWESFLSAQASTEKPETCSDGSFGESMQSASNLTKRKGKSNTKLKVDDHGDCVVSQQQLWHFHAERQRWQAESAMKLRAAESESRRLEEVCRDLRHQLEQQSIQIRCNKVELQKAAKWYALAQQEIKERKEEIIRLTKTQAAEGLGECIVCTNEFGESMDRQRALWKDCHHANICYKCTQTLWSSKNRSCPTCKTPASSMPSRLPPRIYL